tara:strand:- start:1015 stop:1218 length:204 start_codon:yes stop_codon:yes gene_type:complete
LPKISFEENEVSLIGIRWSAYQSIKLADETLDVQHLVGAILALTQFFKAATFSNAGRSGAIGSHMVL